MCLQHKVLQKLFVCYSLCTVYHFSLCLQQTAIHFTKFSEFLEETGKAHSYLSAHIGLVERFESLKK